MKKPLTRRDFKGNVYRELLAQAIEKNGGYSSGYHDRYALSWNVALGWGIPDSDKILEKVFFDNEYMEHTREDFMKVVPAARLKEWSDEWDNEHSQGRVWEDVQESMARSVTEGDDDAMRTIRPEIAKRFGLVYHNWPLRYERIAKSDAAFYPAGKEGWKLSEPFSKHLNFDVSFELHGRGGKHLCLTEFEGRGLNVRSDHLAEAIRDDSQEWDRGNYPNEWCQKLLAYIHECDIMFDHKAVRSEFDYQVLFRAAQELNDVYDECEKAAKEAEEVAYWNSRDIATVTA